MLKTNSKQVKEKIKEWILKNFEWSNYEGYYKKPETYEEIKETIARICWDEKPRERGNIQSMFEDWCQGLPSLIDTASYYCYGSAIDLVGDILEQTKEERAKYDEVESEKMMTYLIYKEVEPYLFKLFYGGNL